MVSKKAPTGKVISQTNPKTDSKTNSKTALKSSPKVSPKTPAKTDVKAGAKAAVRPAAKVVKGNTGPAAQKKAGPPVKSAVQNKPAVQKNAPVKKPSVQKLKGKKLEDRIAPGMLGGGVVDPGMAESVDSSTSVQQDQSAGEITNTSYEDTSAAGGDTSGGYLDESSGNTYNGGEDTSAPAETDNTNFNDNTQYDEFSQGDTGQNFVQEAPTWQEPDWVTAQADGSVVIAPPEGMTMDDGMASFPVEIANEAVPMPHDATLNADGSMTVPVPEGTQYSAETNALVFPEGAVALNEIPPEMNAFQNPDGSITMPLPEQGMEFNPETNELNVNNYWVNELAPNNVEVTDTGTVNVTLPESGVEYNDDGSIHMSAGAVEVMDNPPSEYVANCEFAEYHQDGSMEFTPPEGVNVEGGLMEVPHDLVDQMPIPEDVTINADGSINMGLPEGATYNPEINGLIMPAEHFNLNEVPDGVNAYANPDGSSTVLLPEGMEYDSASNTVHMNNYWANEVAPDNVQIGTDGSMTVALPEETQFSNDGSFTIPPEQLDFVDQEVPPFVGDLEFTEITDGGDYHITPPAGVTVDPGQCEVNIPYNAVNEYILPEGAGPVDDFHMNADGTATVGVPEGTVWNADTQVLTLPVDSVPYQEIPEAMSPVANPDGTISVSLQDGMEFNAQSGELHFDNYWVNEMAPEHVEISPNGGMTVTLPSDTQFNADGSFTIPEHSADFIDNPEPAYVAQGPDWANMNPDGSVTFAPPTEVAIDADAGVATMNVDYMQTQFEHQIPEDVTFNPDGTMTVELPQGAVFNPDSSMMTFPASTDIHMNEIPPELNPSLNPDGSVSFMVQEGMNVDANAGTMTFDNYWTNELTPPAVEFSPEGQVSVTLPPETHFADDGSVMIPEGQTDFIETPIPEYIQNGPEWTNMNPDGSVTFTPPDNVVVADGVMEVPFTAMNDMPIPEDVTINADGSINMGLPEGATYNPELNAVIMPPGEMHYGDIPEGISAHFNPDGTMTVMLPEGMEYDAGTNTVEMNNYWANEMAPDNVQINENGSLSVTLPEGTNYHGDEGFTIPPEHQDFINTEAPAFVTDVEFGAMNPDGSYTFTPPEGITVDPGAYQITAPYDVAMEHLIPEDMGPVAEDVHFNPDGTVNVDVPAGTMYNADAGALTFPTDSVPYHEIPPEMSPVMNDNGTITVTLQDGMDYNPANGQLHFDNYWTNELTPEPVNITPTGEFQISLPPETHINADGSFTIPEHSLDFVQNPDPGFAAAGPDWVTPMPDGQIMIETPDAVNVNPELGTATMPVDYMHQQFENYIPEEVHFNPDGTMNVDVPQGTLFDATANSVSFPEGTVHMHEIPQGMEANLNQDGSITLKLPDGVNFDPGTGQMHFDNYWTNEITPPNVEFSPEAGVTVHMPPDTHFSPDGNMTIPEHQADFMEHPMPEYAHQGPDWAAPNPDGSVTVTPPPGAVINPDAGTFSMPIDMAMDQLGGDLIPPEVTLHADGTADIKLPEGTNYNAATNSLSFPAGAVHMNEFPEVVNPVLNPDGSISVTLPQGINYDGATGSIHLSNAMINEIAPAPLEITPNGQFTIHLPEDTQYFEGNSFVISAESSNFIEGGEGQMPPSENKIAS